jgi:very-short-patch-repair endonuclease
MTATIDTTIAATAARQHGIVTRGQLMAAGLTDDAIWARVRAQRLVRVHRCVYRLGSLVGDLCPSRSREMGAVLACSHPCAGDAPGSPVMPGPAAIGHRSALWLLDLLPGRPSGPVHVVMAGGRCRQQGIVVHRVATLPATDVEVIDRIPTTTPIRSILDFAADARPRELEQVIARGERRGQLELHALRERVQREDGRRGVVLLRAILAGPPPAFTRSPAEDGLLRLVREAGLPEPRCNVELHGFEVDLYWPRRGVVVEVDGFAHHGSRRPFERDRDRGFDLAARGVEVHRVTWRQITEKPYVVVRRLAAVLARAEARLEAEARWEAHGRQGASTR